MISAGFASCWPHGGAWPLPTGLGGVVGDALVRAPAVVFGPPGFIYRLILGSILFAAGIATFLIASGFGSRPQEEQSTGIDEEDAAFEDDDDSSSVSLGWAFHAVMSAKARLWRLLKVAYAWLVSSAPPPRSSFERQEPHLGGRAPPSSAADAEQDFEDEDQRGFPRVDAKDGLAIADRDTSSLREPTKDTLASLTHKGHVSFANAQRTPRVQRTQRRGLKGAKWRQSRSGRTVRISSKATM